MFSHVGGDVGTQAVFDLIKDHGLEVDLVVSLLAQSVACCVLSWGMGMEKYRV